MTGAFYSPCPAAGTEGRETAYTQAVAHHFLSEVKKAIELLSSSERTSRHRDLCSRPWLSVCQMWPWPGDRTSLYLVQWVHGGAHLVGSSVDLQEMTEVDTWHKKART